jgi:anti-anti-sigma regulatory factor
MVEEPDCFRLKIERAEIEEQHVEEFLDKMVEWLSSNRDKSMLIDFNKVKWVCLDFMAQIIRCHDDVRTKGLSIQILKVDPRIEVHLGGTATLMASPPPVRLVQSVSTREVLQDIRTGLSDQEIMEKHRLSKKGICSLFKKLQSKGVITPKELEKRKTDKPLELTVENEQPGVKDRDGLGIVRVEGH